MYENANGVMVPTSMAQREVHQVFHYDKAMSVSDMFSDVGSLTPSPCSEPIDDDPAINSLLTAANF